MPTITCVRASPKISLELRHCLKRKKTNGVETEWHTGIAEDEVEHSGAKQLFNSLLIWSIFRNGIQVKGSGICMGPEGRYGPKSRRRWRDSVPVPKPSRG